MTIITLEQALAAEGIDGPDREEVLKFARFLRHHKRAPNLAAPGTPGSAFCDCGVGLRRTEEGAIAFSENPDCPCPCHTSGYLGIGS